MKSFTVKVPKAPRHNKPPESYYNLEVFLFPAPRGARVFGDHLFGPAAGASDGFRETRECRRATFVESLSAAGGWVVGAELRSVGDWQFLRVAYGGDVCGTVGCTNIGMERCRLNHKSFRDGVGKSFEAFLSIKASKVDEASASLHS